MPITPPPPPAVYDQLLTGDANANNLLGSTLSDVVYGLDGDDTMNGLNGPDYLDGGAGNDKIYGSGGNDTLLGGEGDDLLLGTNGKNMLFGGAGDDVLDTGRRGSTLLGGDGADVLTARLYLGAAHVLEGGSGADLFALLQASATAISEITITDFDPFEDDLSIDGQSAATIFNAGAYLVTTATGLRFTPATGDIIHFDGLDAEDMFRAYGLAGDDTIIGLGDDDVIYGGTGNNNLDGANGNDLLVGDRGNDTLYGGNGDDTLGGKNGADWLFGGDGHDVIYAHAGGDRLYGEAGHDLLYSSTQSSSLYGGTGNDVLVARMDKGGHHLLNAGEGADSFDFTYFGGTKRSVVTLADFTLGEDMLTVNGLDLFTEAAFEGWSFDQSGADAVMSLGGRTSVLVQNADADQLNDLIWPILIVS